MIKQSSISIVFAMQFERKRETYNTKKEHIENSFKYIDNLKSALPFHSARSSAFLFHCTFLVIQST